MTLLRPEWLWVVALLLAAAFWLRLRTASGSWRQLMSGQLLTFLKGPHQLHQRPINAYLLVAAGLALAMTGPALPDQQSSGYRQLEAWVLAIDLSRSMDANDVRPTRLIAAREQLLNVAERAGSRAVAAIGFAGDAFLLTPFSTQLTQLRKLLPGFNSDVVEIEGSRIERALSLSANLLRDNQIPNGRVIVFSDGADISDQAIDIADRLNRAGQRLDVVLVATVAGGKVAAQNSPLFVPDSNKALHLAQSGGGQLVKTDRLGRLDIDYLNNLESRLLPDNLGLLGAQPVGWVDMSHWLLLIMAFAMLWLFRRPFS